MTTTVCHVVAQSNFAFVEETILAHAEEQWVCKELKAVYPSHFVCNENLHTWTYPETDSLLLGNQKVFVSETEREIFRELLFPEGRCDRYLSLVSLCDLYFPLLKRKAEEAGVSQDYKYLPCLLSGLNQQFKQGDHSGMWAMDYLVARRLHLRVDSLIDERNGGDFTAKAAFEYLKELDHKFQGDMPLVIAAYRMGMPMFNRTTVPGALPNFESLPELEKQSIRFLAYLKSLLESTRTENQLQHYFDIYAQYEGVVIEKDSKFEAMTFIIGLDKEASHMVNPVFVGHIIPGMYRKVSFLLPIEQASAWKVQRDSVANWRPSPPDIPVDTATTTVYHVVKKGESLGSIAKKHRTTVRKIKSLNKMKSDKLRTGQKLIISKTPSSNSTDNQVSLSEKKEGKSSGDPSNEKNKQGPRTITYKVKNGDSLWKIANKYKGVTPEDIKKWNKCGDNLRPGQKLTIHLPN